MTTTELKDLLATVEGKAKMAAIINARGKDVLRQMCLELTTVVLEQQATIESLEGKLNEAVKVVDGKFSTDAHSTEPFGV